MVLVDDVQDPRIRRRWHVHFPVPDLEETIAAAKEGEGMAAAPVHTTTTSRWIGPTDSGGAIFTVARRVPLKPAHETWACAPSPEAGVPSCRAHPLRHMWGMP
ncbi:hypothetical protein GCM10010299_78420 [Streptomyces tanashiensis]|nr:hypothetical protein GCM10010299_78420 [Streptomyces tanashiensis]